MCLLFLLVLRFVCWSFFVVRFVVCYGEIGCADMFIGCEYSSKFSQAFSVVFCLVSLLSMNLLGDGSLGVAFAFLGVPFFLFDVVNPDVLDFIGFVGDNFHMCL